MRSAAWWLMVTAAVTAGCASRRAYELEYEKPVTNVWVGEKPVAPATGDPSAAAPGAPAATQTPTAQVTSTTAPRPSAWVHGEPERR